jgi:hypothetical protein
LISGKPMNADGFMGRKIGGDNMDHDGSSFMGNSGMHGDSFAKN